MFVASQKIYDFVSYLHNGMHTVKPYLHSIINSLNGVLNSRPCGITVQTETDVSVGATKLRTST